MNDDLSYFNDIDSAIKHFDNTSDKELFDFLDGDDEILKQIALLKIKTVSSKEEAEKIIFTLTEHSSETREYCAFLLNKLMKNENNIKFFTGKIILKQIEKAICDVNPKVCRKILEILPVYKDTDKLVPVIIIKSFHLIDELREKNKNKNYQYNTKSFHLYWNIFALAYVLNAKYFNEYKDKLFKLLDELALSKEYTIREKAAHLAKKIYNINNTENIKIITDKFGNDENFYVKSVISSII